MGKFQSGRSFYPPCSEFFGSDVSLQGVQCSTLRGEERETYLSISALTHGYQLVQFRVTHLHQARKYLLTIGKYGKFTFLLAGLNFDLGILQLFFKFCGETRRTGLMPSGCTVDNFELHLCSPF